MTREKTYNFAAGPAVLPTEVLETASKEMLDYHGSGMSVMEMSHRSAIYQTVFNDAKNSFKQLLNVPDNYEVLFLQGGASTQFSMVPLNLMGEKKTADYVITGNFSKIAANEAKKYGTVNIAYDTTATRHTTIPAQDQLVLDPDASYFHYCANNTIYGTEWKYVPDTGDVPIACDMSSNIMSQEIDVSKYGIIYAGAQKNLAPAGLTIVIINKALAGSQLAETPLMLNYETMINKDSMYNTPPCYNIYILGLVLHWIEKQGGVKAMKQLKEARSGLLYDFLDNSDFYHGLASKEARSGMNVTFTTESSELDGKFAKEASEAGLLNLKGHRVAGGIRASLYNAQSIEAVEALIDFMKEFEVNNRG